jgi:hypothetical protein
MVPASPRRAKAPRLAFCARSTARGGVDGAWWPSSTNLSAQLPDLVSVLGLTIGEVRRVVYDPSTWPPTPPRIIKGSNAISVDPYPLVASDTIYLIGTHARDAVLYVIPPKSAVAVVDRLLAAVSEATGPMNAFVLRHLLTDCASTVGRPAR